MTVVINIPFFRMWLWGEGLNFGEASVHDGNERGFFVCLFFLLYFISPVCSLSSISGVNLILLNIL